MSTGMIIYIIVMTFTLLIVGGLTFLMYKYDHYKFISGYGNRPKEEQKKLLENGYPQAVRRLMLYTTIILLMTFIGGLFTIP
ncbi:DUF3784 domain-containing protein [Alkalibacillus aidingensis]|uniref:DUF3784 domain-containing protein n=1 Tax=Alkalibacillus aidingensis TaxID=2747607 RepID=UPI0016602F83|nr:DUF3784 domain-containing protein [Alkalibacillus aidingensis]